MATTKKVSSSVSIFVPTNIETGLRDQENDDQMCIRTCRALTLTPNISRKSLYLHGTYSRRCRFSVRTPQVSKMICKRQGGEM